MNNTLRSLLKVDNADLGTVGQASGLPIDPTSIPLQPGLTNDELAQEQAMSSVQTPAAMPDNYNDLAQQEAMEQASVPAPRVAPQNEGSVPGNLLDRINSGKLGLAPGSDASRSPAVEPTQLSRFEQLSKQLEDLRAQEKQQAEDDNNAKFNQNIIAAITEGLGKYMTGGIQKNVKAPIQYTGTTAKDIMSIVGDRKRPDTAKHREELLKEYGLLKSATKSTEITPYQQAQLELQKRWQDLREQGMGQQSRHFDTREDRLRKGQDFTQAQKDELSDKQVTSIKGFDDTLGALDRIESQLPENEQFLGPYASRAQNAKEYIPGQAMDPKFAGFQSDVVDTMSQYIKGLSGLTVSDKERSALIKGLPTLGDKPSTFKAKIAATRARLQDMQKRELEAYGKYQGKSAGKAAMDAESKQQAPHGETVERNGKKYRWNPAVGKYQLDQ